MTLWCSRGEGSIAANLIRLWGISSPNKIRVWRRGCHEHRHLLTMRGISLDYSHCGLLQLGYKAQGNEDRNHPIMLYMICIYHTYNLRVLWDKTQNLYFYIRQIICICIIFSMHTYIYLRVNESEHILHTYLHAQSLPQLCSSPNINPIRQVINSTIPRMKDPHQAQPYLTWSIHLSLSIHSEGFPLAMTTDKGLQTVHWRE